MKKQAKRKVFGITATTFIFIGIVTGMMVFSNLMAPIMPERFWRPIRATEIVPGAGNCGVAGVYIYPHQADPGTTYNTNVTEASAYAHFDSTPTLNESLEHNVPYDTAFDIVVRCQFNYTVAYNTTSADWDIAYVKGLITSADLSIGSDTEMSKSTDFIWTSGNSAGDYGYIQFYMNNGGSGYTKAHSTNVNITDFTMQGYW